MNYTQNYQLPQWAETDRILRTDFNGMTEALESALNGKGNCRLFTGSYVGTGTKEQSFTFPEKPWLVAILGGSFFILTAHGITQTVSLSSFRQTMVNLTWTGNTASWDVFNYDQDACNLENVTYQVVALLDTAE